MPSAGGNMNTLGQMKDPAGPNGVSVGPMGVGVGLLGGGGGSGSGGSGGGGGNTGPTTTIPSLKRTLSGGASGAGHSHALGVGPPGPPSLAGHLGVGMNPMPSVLHASLGNSNNGNNNTGPPQMLRAVTSSGVFNRPGSLSGVGGGGGRGLSAASIGGGGGGGSATGSTAMPTTTRSGTQSSMQDWRMYLTIEERQAVRSKIRDAYSSRCASYEDLLQVACAIEEELLHISAPSRLDYFKSGFEFENRVKLKKDQLQGQLAALDSKRGRPTASPTPHSTATGPSSSSSSSASIGGGNHNNSPAQSKPPHDGSGPSYTKKPRT